FSPILPSPTSTLFPYTTLFRSFQTLVINQFVETATFVLIDFKAGTDNGVALILVNEFYCFFVSCHFVCFVGKSDRLSTGKQRFSTSQCLLKAAEHRRIPKHFVRNPCQPGDSCF